jgi:hypothetical protein
VQIGLFFFFFSVKDQIVDILGFACVKESFLDLLSSCSSSAMLWEWGNK